MKNPHEFWTAIGNKLRPSISLTVTISMQPFAPHTETLVEAADLRIGERTSSTETKIKPATLQGPFSMAGKITDADGLPVEGAVVSVATLGLTVITDKNGFYRLTGLAPGTYSTRVQKGAATKDVTFIVPAPAGSNYNVKLTVKLTG